MPESKKPRCMPTTASEGIHDNVVTLCSMRTWPSRKKLCAKPTGQVEFACVHETLRCPRAAAQGGGRYRPGDASTRCPRGCMPLRGLHEKGSNSTVTAGPPKISVFLADDSLLVREGVRALLAAQPDLDVVGVAEDFDSLIEGTERTRPQVLVTDIRMPPSFQNEGIEAAKLVRMRTPGTGVVVLSQYDEPEYAISLLSEGAAGYAYLLKDRVGDGDQLVRAVREVATGGSMLDPAIVNALVAPARGDDELD